MEAEKKHYSFGHGKEVATLDIEDNDLVVSIEHKYGNDYLNYLTNYKEFVGVRSITDKGATLTIHNLDILDDVVADLVDVTKIKSFVTVGSNKVHIKFSERPYKKVVNHLRNSGYSSNKKQTKFWRDNVTYRERCEALTKLNSFKYLRVIVRYKGDENIA